MELIFSAIKFWKKDITGNQNICGAKSYTMGTDHKTSFLPVRAAYICPMACPSRDNDASVKTLQTRSAN